MRLLTLLAFLVAFVCVSAQKILTPNPVIGIVSQVQSKYDPQYPNRQYIAASYVKWIESAGGRVVPVPMNLPKDQHRKLISQLNGLLLPGGGTYISEEVKQMLSYITELHEQGDYFPVWGTCMGFQWMSMFYANQYNNFLDAYNSYNVSYALEWTPNARNTTFYNYLPFEIRNILSNPDMNVTLNNHHWGVSPEKFQKYLANQFNLISINNDEDGKTFVSTMQHKLYPVFGVQWHPEKNNFELGMDPGQQMHEAINHSLEAILASQYASNFFVHQCRFNGHKFASWEELEAKLIYNYAPVRSGVDFVQKYYFDTFVF